MKQIAGRENEPAGTVFKNVKLLKDVPAGEFLKTMDEIYGRGLGMVCTGCHIADKWDDDSRKNKIIARQMQRMTNELNTDKLPQVKELDEDWHHVSCVMCHRGTGHAANTMPVPPAPASTTPAPTTPPSGIR
jgi:photosynthetic reaction center cytochrome c subunit